MQVEWHKFGEDWPETGRELLLWGEYWLVLIVESMSEDGSAWSNEHQTMFHLQDEIDEEGPITHWAYFDRPEPPTE